MMSTPRGFVVASVVAATALLCTTASTSDIWMWVPIFTTALGKHRRKAGALVAACVAVYSVYMAGDLPRSGIAAALSAGVCL